MQNLCVIFSHHHPVLVEGNPGTPKSCQEEMGSGDNQEVCEEQPKPSNITFFINKMLKNPLSLQRFFIFNKLQLLRKSQETEPLNTTNFDDFLNFLTIFSTPTGSLKASFTGTTRGAQRTSISWITSDSPS